MKITRSQLIRYITESIKQASISPDSDRAQAQALTPMMAADGVIDWSTASDDMLDTFTETMLEPWLQAAYDLPQEDHKEWIQVSFSSNIEGEDLDDLTLDDIEDMVLNGDISFNLESMMPWIESRMEEEEIHRLEAEMHAREAEKEVGKEKSYTGSQGAGVDRYKVKGQLISWHPEGDADYVSSNFSIIDTNNGKEIRVNLGDGSIVLPGGIEIFAIADESDARKRGYYTSDLMGSHNGQDFYLKKIRPGDLQENKSGNNIMKITRRQIRRLIEAEIFDFDKERRKRSSGEELDKIDREKAQQAVSGDSDDDWVYDIEGEIEALMKGIESGKVVDLADSDPFDDDPMTEQKGDDGMYGGPSGLAVPYGDEIYEDEDYLEEDDADAARDKTVDMQAKLRADTAAANKGDTLARLRMRGDQAGLSNQDDGIDF